MLRWTSELRRAVVAAALVAVPGAALADVLVVRSIGPSAGAYKPGRKLPDQASVTLKAGDQLTLLDNKGTRTLKGPGTFPVLGQASATAPSLASLAGTASGRRARTGAVRDVRAMGGDQRPNIWVVDAGQPGTTCVPGTDSVAIWRKDASAAGTTIVARAGGQQATLTWIPGQSTQPWPASVPVTPGATYMLSGAGAAASGTPVSFALMSDTPSGLGELGSMLIASGCQAQLDVLIATADNGG